MRMLNTNLRLLALSALLAAAPLAGAHAQTVEAALERFRTLVEDQGVKLEWTSADISGPDAVLVGVSVGNEEAMLPIGNIAFAGISQADNGYRVETISLDRYRMDGDPGFSFSADGIEMGGVLLPDEGSRDYFGGFLFYERADIGAVNVSVEGAEVFTLTDIHFETTFPEGGNPMEFTGAAEGFMVDLSLTQGSDQHAILQALGYERLNGYFEVAGSWQPDGGRLTMSQYDITVVDAGTLGISLDLNGYTPDFIKALRELQQQMAANPDGDSTAQGFAMLGLMQQLSFHGAEIAFSDDSLTGKVLEFVAQSQGASPADIANMAKAMLPFALAQLNNPELTASATAAVSRFLDDPKVLRITAGPAEPVPFALIMANAMSTPQELTKTLSVRVTAND